MQIPFFQRARNVITANSADFKKYFIDYDYLLISYGFTVRKKYLLKTTKGNYLHLTGVKTTLGASVFFDRCLDGTIQVSDIDSSLGILNQRVYKGLVRKKIQVLPEMSRGINSTYVLEENFIKNRVSCSVASANTNLTLGFVSAGAKVLPMSLLNRNLINPLAACTIDIMLRRKTNESRFNHLVIGTTTDLRIYLKSNPYLDGMITNSLKRKMKTRNAKLKSSSKRRKRLKRKRMNRKKYGNSKGIKGIK